MIARTKKFLINNLTLIIFLALLVVPAVSFALSSNGGLVPCDNSSGDVCNFTQLMNLVNGIIHFILFFMAVPIAAIMFAYAGFLMVTSGGSTESRSKAKSIFTNALIGLAFAVAAWLIVRTILSILGYSAPWIGF